MRRAVIDVGSGSVLTLVAEQTNEGWSLVRETSEITALGEGTKQTGALGEPGMAATLAALDRGYKMARELGAESIQAAATMAVRIAQNAEQFLERADSQDTPLRVLTADEEAKFAFLAAANDPHFIDVTDLVVIDPGGQSTEIICATRTGSDWSIEFEHSFSLGTLALRGGILSDPTPDISAIFQASSQVDSIILGKVPVKPGATAVILGAPGTDLVMIRDRRTEWDAAAVHGASLDFEEVSKAVGWMMRMNDEERAQLPGVAFGRHRTVHIGALILERVLNALAVSSCRVSVRGWRWALLDEPISG